MGLWNILVFIPMLALAIMHIQTHESIKTLLWTFSSLLRGWRILNKAMVHFRKKYLFICLLFFFFKWDDILIWNFNGVMKKVHFYSFLWLHFKPKVHLQV